MRVLAVGIGLARPIWARRAAVCVVWLVAAWWEQVEQLPKCVFLRYEDFPLQQRLAGKPSGLCCAMMLPGSREAAARAARGAHVYIYICINIFFY